MKACVDASLLVKLATPEVGSDRVRDWFAARTDWELIAPSFMPVEIASALRKKIARHELTSEQGVEALRLIGDLDIRLMWDWTLAEQALDLASELTQPTAYDTAYLALAQRELCSLVTGDAAFAAACGAKYSVLTVP